MSLEIDVAHRLGSFRLEAAFTAEGGVTALFGPSGSGKTSLVRIVAGLLRPDRGRVTVDGRVLVDTERRIFVPAHRRRIGYVFQDARLFPNLDVRHNLDYGRRVRRLSRDPGYAGQIDAMLDLGPLRERRIAELSGGERQRVALGRALLSRPRLLLLDEPMASLDDARKAEILPYLIRLRDRAEMPIVYVSHDAEEMRRLVDNVVLLEGGRAVASGTIDLLPG
jgi:molybdate transport system ATP-binding protein